MWILPLLGLLGQGLGFCLVTLALASSLYYLSELVEEHTVATKRVLTYLVYAIVTIHLLLLVVDRFPFKLVALGVLSHLVYKRNLRQFPNVRLRDPWFVASCLLVALNHYFWFKHFSSLPTSGSPYVGRSHHPLYASSQHVSTLPSFSEVASFFGICVWLAPFSLFISLSAGDHVLPLTTSTGSGSASTSRVSSSSYGGRDSLVGGTVGQRHPGAVTGRDITSIEGDHGIEIPNASDNGNGNGLPDETGSTFDRPPRKARRDKRSKGMARAMVDGAWNWLGESGEAMGLWKGERTRRW